MTTPDPALLDLADIRFADLLEDRVDTILDGILRRLAADDVDLTVSAFGSAI